MKWTMVLLALAALTGDTVRVQNEGKEAIVKETIKSGRLDEDKAAEQKGAEEAGAKEKAAKEKAAEQKAAEEAAKKKAKKAAAQKAKKDKEKAAGEATVKVSKETRRDLPFFSDSCYTCWSGEQTEADKQLLGLIKKDVRVLEGTIVTAQYASLEEGQEFTAMEEGTDTDVSQTWNDAGEDAEDFERAGAVCAEMQEGQKASDWFNAQFVDQFVKEAPARCTFEAAQNREDEEKESFDNNGVGDTCYKCWIGEKMGKHQLLGTIKKDFSWENATTRAVNVNFSPELAQDEVVEDADGVLDFIDVWKNAAPSEGDEATDTDRAEAVCQEMQGKMKTGEDWVEAALFTGTHVEKVSIKNTLLGCSVDLVHERENEKKEAFNSWGPGDQCYECMEGEMGSGELRGKIKKDFRFTGANKVFVQYAGEKEYPLADFTEMWNAAEQGEGNATLSDEGRAKLICDKVEEQMNSYRQALQETFWDYPTYVKAVDSCAGE